MRTRRSHGFTLVELMVVVAIIGILAALATASWSGNKNKNVVDNWTQINRDAVLTAARRAIVTRQPYMVYFTPQTVQWCVVKNQGTPPAYTDVSSSCAGLATTDDQGRLVNDAELDAMSSFTAPSTDINGAAGVTAAGGGLYAAPAKTTLVGQALYFGKNGAVSTSYVNVLGAGIATLAGVPNVGFTLYTRRKSVDVAGAGMRLRLLVYGFTGKTRIIEDN